MKFIKLTIKCNKGENDIPDDLRDIIDVPTDWRIGYIAVSYIFGFYPSSDNKSTLIHDCEDSSWCVKETVEEVYQLIQNA